MTSSTSARDFGRYLDAIVELTHQQDSQELMGSLLATLSKGVGAGKVRLFALSNPEHDTDFNENNIQHAVFNDQFDSEFGEPRRLGEDPDLVQRQGPEPGDARRPPRGVSDLRPAPRARAAGDRGSG